MRVAAWIGVLLAACGSSEPDADPDGSDTAVVDTAPVDLAEPSIPSSGATLPTTSRSPGTRAFPKPTELTVTCSPGANALRFDCHVAVTPAQPVEVSFEKADGTGFVRAHTSDDVATDHDLTLYFMEPWTEYAWTAVATAWPDDPVVSDALTAGGPPGGVPDRIEVGGATTAPMIAAQDPCSAPGVAMIFDASTGALLWYQRVDPSGASGPVELVRFTEDHTVLGRSDDRVVEIDLLGNVLVERDVPVSEPVRSALVGTAEACAGSSAVPWWSPLEGW